LKKGIFKCSVLSYFSDSWRFYVKDKNQIFDMRAGILENVDYKTFKIKKGLTGCVAKDKNCYVFLGD